MRHLLICALCAALLCPAAAGAGTPINKKNWRTHPAVKEVRKVYKEVVALERGRKLRKKARKFDVCEPGVDAVRRIFTDAAGRVRKYQYEGGTEDRAVVASFYYTKKERLMFAFVVVNYAGNDDPAGGTASASYRVYFNGAGKQIWSHLGKKGAPQGMVPAQWPEAGIVREPQKALAEEHPCAKPQAPGKSGKKH